MGRKCMNLASESVDDELNVCSGYSLYGLLYNMIAILILHTFQYVRLQLPYKLGLLICEDMF